eukprot:COSAG02_NODE_6377_length_3612_cov_2.589525_2_plen_107_part_00
MQSALHDSASVLALTAPTMYPRLIDHHHHHHLLLSVAVCCVFVVLKGTITSGAAGTAGRAAQSLPSPSLVTTQEHSISHVPCQATLTRGHLGRLIVCLGLVRVKMA